jgi:hypothetical protein
MPENFVFETEAAALLEAALERFAEWAAENYLTTEAEAQCLTEPTEAPAAYARGYNDAIRAIPDALSLWMEEYQYD